MQNGAGASLVKGPEESPIPLIGQHMYSPVVGYIVIESYAKIYYVTCV